MKTLYLDCFSGISGDMMLGALIDCGVDKNELIRQLALLPCRDEFELLVQKTERFGITGTDVTVKLTEPHHPEPNEREHQQLHSAELQPAHTPAHSHVHAHAHNEDVQHAPHSRIGYTAIASLIEASGLAERAKQKALDVFACIAAAEAQVHGKTVEEVHFHEVGAVDSIVDICGTAIAMELLGVERIICSPVNLGGGTVRCDHGLLPVPAPATALILSKLKVYGDDPACGELTTPTGAAIVKTLCASFGSVPMMKIRAVGYGLGKRETGKVNALRVLLGETDDVQPNEEDIIVLEANIDDMTAESLAYAAELLREESALEVYFTPVLMKKGRPAQVLSVVARPVDELPMAELILRHTTTLGVRISRQKRRILNRCEGVAETPYGRVRFKEAWDETGFLRRKPEYDDCAAIAKANNLTLEDIYSCVKETLKAK